MAAATKACRTAARAASGMARIMATGEPGMRSDLKMMRKSSARAMFLAAMRRRFDSRSVFHQLKAASQVPCERPMTAFSWLPE